MMIFCHDPHDFGWEIGFVLNVFKTMCYVFLLFEVGEITLSNFLENLGELGTEKVRLKSINDNPTMIYSRDEEGNILYKKAEEDKIKQEKAAREKARQERSKKNKDKLLTQQLYGSK